ncbi:anthocyanidin 3-O-glucosyltransferase 1-like [Hevea brasiliensis]|uniref:anthocyanidin 3-O-glucosyltransferase 1-like n=1 Tax=Hevea brasiliensis TaxID=3981 RepID=UPI0025FF6316|nr:anthocyanidin 3-O-glucosyltransferase 1-like [Hevea brasiliensis]
MHGGYRFLWSLSQPPPSGLLATPSDYEDPQEILPEGFFHQTSGIGKVIGRVGSTSGCLGSFSNRRIFSHCGWNSVLESIWFGVPIATWPMYAEQQFNAFEMVIDLGLAVEIRMDYRNDGGVIAYSNEIERGIKCLMEHDNEKRKKVKEMSERSRMALMNG